MYLKEWVVGAPSVAFELERSRLVDLEVQSARRAEQDMMVIYDQIVGL